jgi:hypothetical protein
MESRDPAHRCAAFQEGRDATLARCDAGIRGLGGSDEIAAAARALRKGCTPMTMRYERLEPNFKTLTSTPSISLDPHRLGSS